MSSDNTILEAQKKLEQRRRELGIDTTGQAAPVLQLRATDFPKAPLRIAGSDRCARCGSAVSHPGICDACGKALADEQRAAAAAEALRREMPPRFMWASWEASDLSARILASRVRGGAAKVTAARELFGRRARVVLVGEAGAGKSSLAAAWLRDRIEAGLGARWVSAVDLATEEAPEGGATPFQRALSAPLLVLDDLGAELHGAPKGSGVLAQRIEAAGRVLHRRHDRDLPTVITTAIGAELVTSAPVRELQAAMAEVYGDGIARRVYEGAGVVRLGGAS